MRAISASLVQDALASRREAVREIVDTLTPIIQHKAARALLRRSRYAGGRDVRQEVEDLTQQVFLALFDDKRGLRQWDADRSELQGFVAVFAEHEIASILRTRRRSPWGEDPTVDALLDSETDPPTWPEPQVGSREALGILVERVRDNVNERGLQLFFWLVVEERTIEEVQALAGMSRDAVYQWKSRLLRLVRKLCADIVSETNEPSRST